MSLGFIQTTNSKSEMFTSLTPSHYNLFLRMKCVSFYPLGPNLITNLKPKALRHVWCEYDGTLGLYSFTILFTPF